MRGITAGNSLTTDYGSQPATTPVRDPDTPGDLALFTLLTTIFGLLAVATVVIALFTARLGVILTSGTNNRMIAISAALVWIFLGSVLAYRAIKPLHRIAGYAVQAVLVFIAIAAAIEFMLSVQGSHLFIETLLVGAGRSIIGPASSPISPAAAALAVPASLALVLLIRGSGHQGKPSRVPDAASLLGWAIVIASFTFVLSYAYGNPLLYGTPYIPIAFLSALAAIFTGAALVAAAGPQAAPVKYLIGNSTRAGLLRVFVPLVAAVAILENVVFVELSSWFNLRDAVLLSCILVLFVITTAIIVAKVSGRIGTALDRAELALERKNEELHAFNEELTATQEELRQTNDELVAHEHLLTANNEELGALNEELTASDEELRFTIDKLVTAEKGLRESQKENTFLADLLNHSDQPFGVGYPDGRLGIVNGAFERLTGYSADELRSMDWATVLTPPGWQEIEREKLEELNRTGLPVRYEKEYLRKDGTLVPIELLVHLVRGDNGEPLHYFSFITDITERKRAREESIRKNEELGAMNEELTATQEELHQNIDELSHREQELSRALVEKEVLLSEIHHRVKNNLTAFISLLSLEGSTEDTPAGKLLKQDLQNRARSMALVHETLYRTNMYDEVDMGLYLKTLTDQIANSFRTTRSIGTVVDAEGVMLDISRATPTGLIINELITNSFKYAFPGSYDVMAARNAPPAITIALRKTDGTFELIFRDNGVGLPAGFDIGTTRTLGLKLVNFLARHQLRAKVEVNTGKGTEFIIRFRE